MKKNLTMFMFYMIMIMGTLITLSSNNWLIMWMGLEINMISFIPILKSKKKKSSQSMMIYFLIQSMGSMILLLSVLMMKNQMMNYLTILAIIIKMGAAPFHMWMPEMMNMLEWDKCLILSTWQKIAPLILMTQMNSNLISIVSVISAIVGAIGGINQISIRKIMAFSSINHIGWMMSCMNFNKMIWMKYMFFYFFMNMMLMLMLKMKNMYQINQLNFNQTFTEKMNLGLLMMSMGGMPPLMGFIPKWMMLSEMLNNKLFLMMFMMIMPSLITLFFYMRIITPMLILNSSSLKIMNNYKNKYLNIFMMSINTMTIFILIMIL